MIKFKIIGMMKRSLLIFILLGLFVHVSKAQDLWKIKRYEAFATIGTTHFFGDIGGFSQTKNILGFRDISFKQTRLNLGGGIKYRIVPRLNIRGGLTFGVFHATDGRGSNEPREMNATTTFFEPTLCGEYFIIKSKKEDSYLFIKGKRTPIKSIMESIDIYALTGIGGLGFKVKGNDELVSLGFTDHGFTAIIPVGIGITLLVHPNYNLGLELSGRYTFSDFIDGYTSQYSRSNDVYYFLNFTFTYKIITGSNGLPRFLNKSRF